MLVDVQMPGVGGLEALRVLCGRPDAPPAAVLTTFDLDDYVAEALRLGVQGFLLKDAEPDALVRAVLDLAAGGAVLDPRITARLLPRLAAGTARPGPSKLADLTPREVQVEDGDPVDVAPGTGRAVYRVVQESLTNAARHAAGARVSVRLRWRTTELVVEVRNGPSSAISRHPDAGGGAGLTGLAERVSASGGDLTAGAQPDGGFAVRAAFPLDPPPPAPAEPIREQEPALP